MERLLPKPSSGWTSPRAVVFTPPAAPVLQSELLNCPGAQILVPWVQGKADIRYLPPASSCKRSFESESRSCQPMLEVHGSGPGEEALTPLAEFWRFAVWKPGLQPHV